MPAITGEIYVNGGWTDITSLLYVREDIHITRGAPNEASRPDASKCELVLDNRSGDLCPYNPLGQWYGQIGQNTPFRLAVDGEYRVAVELTSLPQKWDLSGNDVYVPVEGFGIRNRLTSGSQDPLASTLYRGKTHLTPAAVAYWPCEDGKASLSIASGIGGRPMEVKGTIDFANYDNIPATLPLPTLKKCYLDGSIPFYTVPSPNKMQLRFILHIPDDTEVPDDTIMMDLHNTGTAGLWRILYSTGGSLKVRVDDRAYGNILFQSGALLFDVLGKDILVSFELAQNGSNVDWNLATLEVGQVDGLVVNSTLNSRTIGRATRVFGDPLQLCDGITVGQISVQPDVTSLFDLSSELNAWVGEAAGLRVQRLCDQEGIALVAVGDLSNTARMGPQLPLPLINLLDECADADFGTLFEPKDQTGLAYRTLADTYNQPATLALDYAAAHVFEPFEPTPDTQGVRNDITAKSPDGSSARYVQATGPLSVKAPGAGGVGRYASEITVNVAGADQLGDAAGFAVALGTVNEPRYPSITVNLLGIHVREDGKDTEAKAVDIGDRITVDNPKAGQSPDQVAQLARGYAETVNKDTHVISYNCAPASPYDIMQTGTAGKSGVDSGSSTLATSYAAGVSPLSVVTSDAYELWTTDASAFPFDVRISGEVVTVTNITGASSPQSFTVTRGVNNINKTLPSGAEVHLARLPRIGY